MPATDLAIPILPSRSFERTQAFYGKLGFEGGAVSPDYAILRRGPIELHFFLHPDLAPADSWAGCYLRLADVDSMYMDFAEAKLPAQGIPRMDRLENKPWGLREFAVIDEDGNLLRIGQIL